MKLRETVFHILPIALEEIAHLSAHVLRRTFGRREVEEERALVLLRHFARGHREDKNSPREDDGRRASIELQPLHCCVEVLNELRLPASAARRTDSSGTTEPPSPTQRENRVVPVTHLDLTRVVVDIYAGEPGEGVEAE